jgi:hypothetical protein
MVISPLKVSKISENISGRDPAGQVSEIPENYYQGFLGMYRLRGPRELPGQD